MNNERRAEIRQINKQINDLHETNNGKGSLLKAAWMIFEQALSEYIDTVQEIADSVDNLKTEEEDYKENMPESLQEGDEGQKADVAIEALESAHSGLTDYADSADTLKAEIQVIIDGIDDGLSDVLDDLDAAAE